MVRTLISYTLAAGIVTPPALLSTQTAPPSEVKPAVSQYPPLYITQPVHTHAILHNPSTVVPPPVVIPTPQIPTPQFVAYRSDPIQVQLTLESLPPPESPPELIAIPETPMPIVRPDVSSVAALPPPPPLSIETWDIDTPDTSTSVTDLTVLRDVVSQAHITSTAPVTAYDIMSGEPLWETTESLTVEAHNYQVLLDDQPHTELILTVPDDELITVNGTEYPDGLIIRAQDHELYVINYLSGDQVIAIQPDISSPVEQPLSQSHPWYDLDGRLPEPPLKIAQHGSP